MSRNRNRHVDVGIYREDPAGEEHEVVVTVEYGFQRAEPDVGIMSGYVEVQSVRLQNEDGSDGPLLHWSQADQDDFDEGQATDLCDDEHDDHDAAYDAWKEDGDRR